MNFVSIILVIQHSNILIIPDSSLTNYSDHHSYYLIMMMQINNGNLRNYQDYAEHTYVFHKHKCRCLAIQFKRFVSNFSKENYFLQPATFVTTALLPTRLSSPPSDKRNNSEFTLLRIDHK